jgi:hypothetical protein
MAGYSGTPLWKKLGIRPGDVVTLLDAPPGFAPPRGAAPTPTGPGAARSAGQPAAGRA